MLCNRVRMGKAKTKIVDSRKPKHSLDSSRPGKTPTGKGGKQNRDAATVRHHCPVRLRCWSPFLGTKANPPAFAGQETQYVQDPSKAGHEGKNHF